MQHSMHNITNQFRRPGGAKAARLRHGFVQANENFAVQFRYRMDGRRVRVIKGDDIGGTGVPGTAR